MQADQKKLVIGGALVEPLDGAIFIFVNVSKEEIDAFMKTDPYVQNKLVSEYKIRPYIVPDVLNNTL
jgi:uncharacterized protein YciI